MAQSAITAAGSPSTGSGQEGSKQRAEDRKQRILGTKH